MEKEKEGENSKKGFSRVLFDFVHSRVRYVVGCKYIVNGQEIECKRKKGRRQNTFSVQYSVFIKANLTQGPWNNKKM